MSWTTAARGRVPELLALASWLLALATAAAPATGQPPVAGLVLRASPGAPLGGAKVVFHPDHPPAPRWAEEWRRPALPAVQTQTDTTGRFSLRGGHGPGFLVVSHPRGFGALAARAAPGAPQRIQAQPLVPVELDGAASVNVMATPAGERPCKLGRFDADGLRLPAGSYRLLLHSEHGLTEARCELRLGQPHRVSAPPLGVRRVVLPPRFAGEVTLAGWPSVVLTPHDDALALTAAPGPRRLRIHWHTESGTALTSLWLPAGNGTTHATLPALTWRTAVVESAANDSSVGGARVDAVRRGARGAELASTSTTDARGVAHFVVGTDTYLVVHRPGWAHEVREVPASPSETATTIALGQGFAVAIAVHTPGRREIAGVTVELRHSNHPSWSLLGRTGPRGRVRFTDVPAGIAIVRVRDAALLASERQIAVAEAATGHVWSLTAAPGARLVGRVVYRDGRAASRVAVTLRDTTGLLGDTPRATHTDAEGRFRFAGLLEDELYTLSSSIERHGRTWSAQRRGVQPGDTEWQLELGSEDPIPPHRRKD